MDSSFAGTLSTSLWDSELREREETEGKSSGMGNYEVNPWYDHPLNGYQYLTSGLEIPFDLGQDLENSSLAQDLSLLSLSNDLVPFLPYHRASSVAMSSSANNSYMDFSDTMASSSAASLSTILATTSFPAGRLEVPVPSCPDSSSNLSAPRDLLPCTFPDPNIWSPISPSPTSNAFGLDGDSSESNDGENLEGRFSPDFSNQELWSPSSVVKEPPQIALPSPGNPGKVTGKRKSITSTYQAVELLHVKLDKNEEYRGRKIEKFHECQNKEGSYWVVHLENHVNARKQCFVCNSNTNSGVPCNVISSSYRGINRHFRAKDHQNANTKLFECEHPTDPCDRTFLRQDVMKRHVDKTLHPIMRRSGLRPKTPGGVEDD